MGSGSSKKRAGNHGKSGPFKASDFKDNPGFFVEVVRNLPIEGEIEKFPFFKCQYRSSSEVGFVIIKPGAVSDFVYCVISGKCIQFKNEDGADGYGNTRIMVDRFCRGDCFGIDSCLYRIESNYSIYVCPDTKLLLLPKSAFGGFELSIDHMQWATRERNIFANVGDNNSRPLFDKIVANAVHSSWLFNNWKEEDLSIIVNDLTRRNLVLLQPFTFLQNRDIINDSKNTVLLLKGEVEFKQDDSVFGTINVTAKDQVMSLDMENVLNKSTNLNIQAKSPSYVLFISLEKIMNSPMEKLFMTTTLILEKYINFQLSLAQSDDLAIGVLVAMILRCKYLAQNFVDATNDAISLIFRSFYKCFVKGDTVQPKNQCHTLVILCGCVRSLTNDQQVTGEKDITFIQYQVIGRNEGKSSAYEWKLSCSSERCIILYIPKSNEDEIVNK